MAKKRCIPTGKAKGFESCNDYIDRYKYGMCKACFHRWLKTPEGINTALKKIPIAKKKIEKEAKIKSKADKIKNKSIAILILEARQPFQKLIRIRDHRKTCISCDRMLPYNLGDYDGGHLFKAELYSGLIFNPLNVSGQCVHCNKYLGGNETGYIDGFIKRYGLPMYNNLNSIKDSVKSYRWDRTQLIEMKEHYKKELKSVENGKDINDVDFLIGVIL